MRFGLFLPVLALLMSPFAAQAAGLSADAMSSDKSADIAKSKADWDKLTPEGRLSSVKDLLDAENKKAGGKKPKYDTDDAHIRALTDCTGDYMMMQKPDPKDKDKSREKDTTSLRSIILKKCNDDKMRKDILTIGGESRARERWLGLSMEDRVRNLLEMLNAEKAKPADDAAAKAAAPYIGEFGLDGYKSDSIKEILDDDKYGTHFSEVEIKALLGCANRVANEPVKSNEKLKATMNDAIMTCQKDFPKWLPSVKVQLNCLKDKLPDYPQKGDMKLPGYKVAANDDTSWKPSSPRLRKVIKAMRSCGTAFIRTAPPQPKEGASAPAKQ